MSESEEERKNRRTAMIATAGISAAVLLLMILIAAWRAPDPPLPEYGIELNFGTETVGTGAVQPREPVGTPQQQETEPEAPAETQPEPATTPAQETTPQETSTPEQVATQTESPVAVKEEKKKEEPKPVEKPKEKPVEQKTEAKPEVKKEAPKPDPNTLYKPKAGSAESHGDDANKTGDKGSPEGKVDADALYGKSGGGGGGPSLDLRGWDWDDIPRPQTPNNETGQIKIQVKVDANGELIGYQVIQKSVSAEAERACIQAIQRLTFSKKPGAVVPAETTGTITFVIRSK